MNFMKDILAEIFGNASRLKIMRLFIFNRRSGLTLSEVAYRANLSTSAARSETNSLLRSGFIKESSVLVKKEKKGKISSVKARGFIFNPDFPYTHPFHELLVETLPLRPELLGKAIQKTGRVKAILASGLFVDNEDSSLDLLVIGDAINKGKIEKVIHSFESLIGRDIRYAVLTVTDFNYRLDIYDRMVRDVLDYPHKILLNRLSVNL